jgi:DNA cross-link repair 1C protein
MSTFDGIIKEFPLIRCDNFTTYPDEPPPLACFLSHVHSDHLKGLESFRSTFVYCTAQTRELLLRFEKFPHRMNFAKGILESRKQTYRRLKHHLKPIPLETPTEIELAPGNSIRVTLFDANHCLGSCMFLIEGNARAVLYTGDIRSEQWWVDSLLRNPVLVPYTKGTLRLDNIYLDTTFTSNDVLEFIMPSKAEGLGELIQKVSQYPAETIFYLDTWTFGYEQVWIALSSALKTRVHLDEYRWRLYHSQRDEPSCYGSQTAPLVGFKLGNHDHPGCLTSSPDGVRIHSCERGTRCDVFQNRKSIGKVSCRCPF